MGMGASLCFSNAFAHSLELPARDVRNVTFLQVRVHPLHTDLLGILAFRSEDAFFRQHGKVAVCQRGEQVGSSQLNFHISAICQDRRHVCPLQGDTIHEDVALTPPPNEAVKIKTYEVSSSIGPYDPLSQCLRTAPPSIEHDNLEPSLQRLSPFF